MSKTLSPFSDFCAVDPAVARFLEQVQNQEPQRWCQAQPLLKKALGELHDQRAAVNGYCRTALALGLGTVLGWTLDHPAFGLRLLRLWARSRWLGECLERQPGLLEFLLALPRQAWGEGFLPAAQEAALSRQYAASGFTHLRRVKTEAVFRLGLLDLEGLMDLEAVTQKLSQLADTLLQTGLLLSWRLLHERHNLPPPPTPAPLCVLALGKHGGGEVNYLSDVDLLFLYPDGAVTFPGGLGEERGYANWCELFLSEFGKATSEGDLWRTDMRLRPEGHGGPLVMGQGATFAYYEGAAAPWELLAMARGRVVAGEAPVGQRLLDLCRERLKGLLRHPDVVMDLAEHRHRMAGSRDPASPNVKTGFGGIRDVEWSMFLLGAMASHDHPATWPGQPVTHTLAALREAGLLTGAEHKTFHGNYLWLRRAEHLVMLKAGAKAHTLPDEPGALGEIAQGMGLSTAAFKKELAKRRAANRKVYEALFPPHEAADDHHWLVRVVSTGELAEPLRAALGPQARAAAQLLAAFRVRETAGPQYASLVYGAMSRAAQPWWEGLLATTAPLVTLGRFGRFENLAASRVAFWDMLAHQPALRATLTRLAGASGWLTRHLQTHPQWLDLALKPPTPDFRQSLQESLTLSPAGLHRCQFALLCHWVQGTLTRRELEHDITLAADRLVTLAGEEAKTTGLLAAAVGKWGQGALLPMSDLDFLFFSPSGKAPAPYEKKAQKLLARLTDFTDEGALFEADVRLRPFGSQGALVMATQDALAYYRKADLWEHLAWLSVRGLGPHAPAVAAMRAEVLARAKVTEEKLASLRHVLGRTFTEKNASRPGKRLDLKHCPGGLFHVEALAGVLALKAGLWRHGPVHTHEALGQLHPALAAHYDRLRTVQLWQRVAADLPVKHLTLGQASTAEVAAALGQPPESLLGELARDCATAATLCREAGV